MTSFDEAYDGKFTPITGGNLEVLESLHRTIGNLSSNCNNYYIGITSNGKEGCKSRWNSKYKGLNYTGMKHIYKTDSDKNRKAVETDLIFLKKLAKILTIVLEVEEEVQEILLILFILLTKNKFLNLTLEQDLLSDEGVLFEKILVLLNSVLQFENNICKMLLSETLIIRKN